ncbi:thiolase domain-containing protein [Candidatus Acidianus copahuensis]
MGWYGFRPLTPEVSFREMVFEAATRAYAMADIDPRKDVDTFISCQEDFWEGISIADEFAPDPIGGSMRPTMTVSGDGIQGIVHGAMQILSGISKITVVESHSKPSDIEKIHKIVEFGMDPIYVRTVKSPNVHFLAGLDASKFMKKGYTREDFAEVVRKNKVNGLSSPRSSYASKLSLEDILSQDYVVYPLSKLDIAEYVDGSIVSVLASEEVARKLTDTPIWIDGMYFSSDSTLELSYLGEAEYLTISSREALKMAKVDSPTKLKGGFIDDRYSYKELEHVESIGLNAREMLREGELEKDGDFPVNPLGGHLAKGIPLEASGLSLTLDGFEYLLSGKESAIVASWRGIPTFTGGVLVMRR